MSTPNPDNLNKFMQTLKKQFADLGGVSCRDLVDHTVLSNTPLSQDSLINELVFSMLVWESSIEHAARAAEAIQLKLVDLNELRVCSAEELVSIFPSRYPRSLERSQRLISVLNSIFILENSLSLAHLREMNKRQVVEYFAAIDGLPIFVSSRVILLGLGWHAFPLDDWLVKNLAQHGITDPSLDIVEQTHQVERLVRANEALEYYTLIEHWASDQRVSKLTGKHSTDTQTKASGAASTQSKGTS